MTVNSSKSFARQLEFSRENVISNHHYLEIILLTTYVYLRTKVTGKNIGHGSVALYVSMLLSSVISHG
jgi:hypothetical protein